MTIKQFNQIRAATYTAAMEIPEVAKTIDINGMAYIYDVIEPFEKHEIFCLGAQTQMNNNMLREHGFDPAGCMVSLIMRLDRQAKAATFSYQLLAGLRLEQTEVDGWEKPPISDRLHALRKERKMTQAALAEASGVNLRTIQDVEMGRSRLERMAGESLLKLANVFGISVEDLIGE